MHGGGGIPLGGGVGEPRTGIIYIYISVCVYVYMFIYTYVYIYVCMDACMSLHLSLYIYIYTCMYKRVVQAIRRCEAGLQVVGLAA